MRSSIGHRSSFAALILIALSLFAAASADAVLVEAGLSYDDAADDDLVQNLPRGSIGGGWHKACPGGTAVLSPTGYSTPMWHLGAFSAGNDYGSRGIVSNKTTGVFRSIVGGADIPIDEQTLDAWRATFANVRTNGALATPRFAYTQDGTTGCEPADFDVLLGHVRQIAGVLNEYADVVVSVECGMIGPWGEMHSSKYDGADYDTRIVRAWLDALDPRIKLQVRGPKFLFRIFRKEVLGDICGGIDGETLLARLPELKDWNRLGLFNDGYLGTCADYGTFSDGITSFSTGNGTRNLTRAQAMRWLNRLRAVPYGGELATLTDARSRTWPPFVHEDYNQVKEWYDSHLSYLRGTGLRMKSAARLNELAFSAGRHGFEGAPDLHEWEGRPLLEFMRAHMGYRFVLRASSLSEAVEPGGTLQLAFDVENTGFGDLFLPTKSEILLQAADGRIRTLPVALDLGGAVPSPTRASLSLSPTLPSDIEPGEWRVHLRTRIPAAGDPPSAAAMRTIRFANAAAQWNGALGANLLGTVRVAGAAAAPLP